MVALHGLADTFDVFAGPVDGIASGDSQNQNSSSEQGY